MTKRATANSKNATADIAESAKAWLNVARNPAAYATSGTRMTAIPTVNFSKSLSTDAIFALAAVRRKSLISKMLAAATGKIIRNGMRIVVGAVRGLTRDKMAKAIGTGT